MYRAYFLKNIKNHFQKIFYTNLKIECDFVFIIDPVFQYRLASNKFIQVFF